MNIKRQIIPPIITMIFVISSGMIGYTLIEKWSLFDSLYMTIVTLTTVGFEEVHTLTRAGRIFTVILILSGVGAMFYALSVGARVIFEGEIREILGRKKLSKKIEKIKGHYIICGYGRIGKIICREMKHDESSFVVIEKSSEEISTMDSDILVIQGDSTRDSVLKEAGVERARGVVSVLASDADNLYVVLSARGLTLNLK